MSYPLASQVGSGKEYKCQCRRCRFDPWIGKIPWSWKDIQLQYSCLDYSMDRGAWWAAVHSIEKSWTQLIH